MQVAERRLVREAQRRHRDYERQMKERAKLSAMEQARLEVELFENQLDLLLSVHKECSGSWDWVAVAAALPTPSPIRYSANETRAKVESALIPESNRQSSEAAIINARTEDDKFFDSAKKDHAQAVAVCDELKTLARRVLSGEHKSYTDALLALNPFLELSNLGSSIHFTVHTASIAEVRLKVNGKQAIPGEIKTLTASGSVSTKPMPKTRFQEIYSDYICGCILRVAREMFALLPLEHLLVTATADYSVDTNAQVDIPVLSVIFGKQQFANVDFEQAHAYEVIEPFSHRGNFKLSRRMDAFQPITPLTFEDVSRHVSLSRDVASLVTEVRHVRGEIASQLNRFTPKSEQPAQLAI